MDTNSVYIILKRILKNSVKIILFNLNGTIISYVPIKFRIIRMCDLMESAYSFIYLKIIIRLQRYHSRKQLAYHNSLIIYLVIMINGKYIFLRLTQHVYVFVNSVFQQPIMYIIIDVFSV